MLEYTNTYISGGWYVIPVYGIKNGRCTCNRVCKCPGKHPLTRNGVNGALNRLESATKWWKKNPYANIGVVTGIKSGVLVLDIDPRNGGDESLTKLINDIGELPSTVIADTGGGGQHIYFKYPNIGIKCGNNKLGEGIDIKSDGGYVVAPPSVHASGGLYQWRSGCGPEDVELAELPYSIIQMLTGSFNKLATVATDHDVVYQGERNSFLFRRACSLRERGYKRQNIEALISELNIEKCSPVLSDDEVHKIAVSAAKYNKGNTLPLYVWRDAIRSERGPSGKSKASLRHILINLSFYMDGNGLNCYPTQEVIALETGYTLGHVNNMIELAEELGWIKKISHQGIGQKWRNLVYKPILPQEVLLSEQQLLQEYCPDALKVLSSE